MTVKGVMRENWPPVESLYSLLLLAITVANNGTDRGRCRLLKYKIVLGDSTCQGKLFSIHATQF